MTSRTGQGPLPWPFSKRPRLRGFPGSCSVQSVGLYLLSSCIFPLPLVVVSCCLYPIGTSLLCLCSEDKLPADGSTVSLCSCLIAAPNSPLCDWAMRPSADALGFTGPCFLAIHDTGVPGHPTYAQQHGPGRSSGVQAIHCPVKSCFFLSCAQFICYRVE